MLNDLGFGPISQFGVRSPGHEGAGVVVKIGSNVTNWKVGDRGGVKPTWDVCMNCEFCWNGKHETHCAKSKQTGMEVPGTYQQYIVSPAKYTTRIPDGVDDFCAGPIMCSGSTIHRSVSLNKYVKVQMADLLQLVESQLKAGDWAVFPGAGGGVGHMGVQLAKAMGFRVIGVDGGDEKRALCEKLGCEAFVDFTKVKDVTAEVMKITGLGAQGVFVTAGNAAAYGSAPGMLGVGGKLMCIGLRELHPAIRSPRFSLRHEIAPAGNLMVGAHPTEFILKNLHVIGTKVGSMKDTDAALNFAARVSGVFRKLCKHANIVL